MEESTNKITCYQKCIDMIIMWFYILHLHSPKKCAKTLVIYFYFTSLEKTLPYSKKETLNQIHVNTALTFSCHTDSEIVIFRKEEWFKVLIHETFHTFGLDFSDMDNIQCAQRILRLFKVVSEVNAFEAYTEFWAEIMNALFCSFFSLKDKTDLAEFLDYSEFFINFERTYSFFQMVKTLKFMGLSYTDLYAKTHHSAVLRENLYKEKTHVLSYYIIKCILMNNYQDFLSWCKTNNFSLLQFKKTIANQRAYCSFIEKNYKTRSMLASIKETNYFLHSIERKNKKENYKYILSNLRMSICEMG
jgi:hypothetical protein